MNGKQIIGLVILLAGIGLILYGNYGKEQIREARGDIERKTRIIPDSPVKDVIKGELHSKVDRYREPVKLLFTGGMVLVAVGCVVLFFGRKRKR
ncbi:MAG: hypothetical protein K1000chlam2_01270 [Chlamydiae bacterium]|nr:hypothetical protein [Chlamydiota bacterium]